MERSGKTVKRNKTLVLFGYDWDRIEYRKLARQWAQLHAGFDLFSFPSVIRLAWFDIDRFSSIAALRARSRVAAGRAWRRTAARRFRNAPCRTSSHR